MSALRRVLVANRGEISVRIRRACSTLGIDAVGVFARDDATSTHVTETSWPLPGNGVSAYLDIDALVDIARRAGCDSLHPGYGFLSESPELAEACAASGLVFVGPAPATLRAFGDKVAARHAAVAAGVPVLRATGTDPTPAEAEAFLASVQGPVMVKAVAGGGGRGQRPVLRREELVEALARCRSEAKRSFGNDAVYLEELFTDARHIEVQLVGDGEDVIAIGDRDCSVQRRRQKLVEIAPAPRLSDATRAAIAANAVALGRHARLTSLATVEMLVRDERFVFLEVNPRVQVEHTVTEEAFGVDLVAAQLRIAGGERIAAVGLGAPLPALRAAIELRVNAETVDADAGVRPTLGTVRDLAFPAGVRIDTAARIGLQLTGSFDTLLAKVIVSAPLGDTGALLASAAKALKDVRVDGIATNRDLLLALLSRPELAASTATTTFVDEHIAVLARTAEKAVAVDGQLVITAPLSGIVVGVEVMTGSSVARGASILILESMKMEHAVVAPRNARVERVVVAPGAQVAEGDPIAYLHIDAETADVDASVDEQVDLDAIRPELAELRARLAFTEDGGRATAVAKRRALGRRTTRENLADLIDEGTFIEYGALAIAAQRQRRTLEELVATTPADGVVCGIGEIGGIRTAVVAYDYTVLAGTQGMYGHKKQDRLFELAAREQLPVVLYAEGGGGRPGDTDTGWIAGLELPTFTLLARLSGKVPIVAIVSGRTFAGNAALAGIADVIIATPEVSLGMGGPAMIEGGGLGVVRPDDVGPLSVQVPNGVVDLVAADDADATRLARRVVGHLSGQRVSAWSMADQRKLRNVIPERRSRAYDVGPIVTTLADTDTVIELRPEFGIGVRTFLARIEGQPIGVVANNPLHLGGAIDAPAADKQAQFLSLCDAHRLPVLSLCDTPGFMVGPESEKQATVRRFGRLFVTGANLRVPLCFVALRKAYGLGAMAMAGGHLHAAAAAFAWPTGELGGMGLEGAVRLGYRRELDAIAEPADRQRRFEELVAAEYARGKATNLATVFEIDGVIDPADTRALVRSTLLTMKAS